MTTSTPPATTPPEPSPRELPKRREGAPKPGAKRKRHQRWRRIATLATVLALVGFVIAGVSFFNDQTEDEGIRATKALLDDLGQAIDAHYRRVGELPGQSLGELTHPSSPYKGAVPPEDAYAELIEFRILDAASGDFRLRSSGADRKIGTEDDIVWPEGTAWLE